MKKKRESINRILKSVEKYFFIVVLIAVAISWVYPNSFKWVLNEYSGVTVLNLLLSIVLFAMGTTLKVENFVNVLKRPKEILTGLLAQYLIMPLLTFILVSLFSLDAGLAVGIILVGTVPGGTASDVITFLAGGDVALSVSLTAVSTIIAPLLTPIITLLIIGNNIQFDPLNMFFSIVQIVIVPITLGLLLNYKFESFCQSLKDYLPTISALVICLIVAGVIGSNKQAILTSSVTVFVVIILQYFLAIGLGFAVGLLTGMERKQIVTVAIEIASQNSGLSSGLAKTHFPHLASATVPGALYSMWQNFAGAILAYIFKKYYIKVPDDN